MAWQKNGTPDTLSGAGPTIQITDLTALKFNQYLSHWFATGGNINPIFQVDGNSGSNYSDRKSKDGAGDIAQVNQTDLDYAFTLTAADEFAVNYQINIAGEEKLFIYFIVSRGVAGAGTAPNRVEEVGKFTVTAGQTTRIDINDDGAGSFDTDSNLSALGTD